MEPEIRHNVLESNLFRVKVSDVTVLVPSWGENEPEPRLQNESGTLSSL